MEEKSVQELLENPELVLEMPDEELIRLYEQMGFRFTEDAVILQTETGLDLTIDKQSFLRPSEKSLKELAAKVNALYGGTVEIFDPSDEKGKEFKFSGTRRRNIGRVWLRSSLDCHNWSCRTRNHYKYLQLVGNNVSDDGWTRIFQFVVCVVIAIGILVVFTLLPGGQVLIANFATIAVVVVAGCGALAGVNSHDKTNSYLKTFNT